MPEAMSLCDAAPSSYTESAIFQHADSFTALLVQLSALEHATTAIEELSERLAALEVRLASRETLLHALSREISCRRRKVEELSPGSARSAMLLASKGKQAFAQKLAARESRLQEAMIRLRDEERTVALLQHEIASVSKQVSLLARLIFLYPDQGYSCTSTERYTRRASSMGRISNSYTSGSLAVLHPNTPKKTRQKTLSLAWRSAARRRDCSYIAWQAPLSGSPRRSYMLHTLSGPLRLRYVLV